VGETNITNTPDTETALQYLDTVVRPFIEEQRRRTEQNPGSLRSRASSYSTYDIERHRSWLIWSEVGLNGSRRAVVQMCEDIMADDSFMESLRSFRDGNLIMSLFLWDRSVEKGDGAIQYRPTLLWHKLLGHKLSSLLSPATQFPFEGDRKRRGRVPTSTRKTVWVRDDATCQICGRSHDLPLSRYLDIRRRLGLRGGTREERRGAQRKHPRAYWHCAKPRIDHILPVTVGGPSEEWNLCVLCRLCNSVKEDKFVLPLVEMAVRRLHSSLHRDRERVADPRWKVTFVPKDTDGSEEEDQREVGQYAHLGTAVRQAEKKYESPEVGAVMIYNLGEDTGWLPWEYRKRKYASHQQWPDEEEIRERSR